MHDPLIAPACLSCSSLKEVDATTYKLHSDEHLPNRESVADRMVGVSLVFNPNESEYQPQTEEERWADLYVSA